MLKSRVDDACVWVRSSIDSDRLCEASAPSCCVIEKSSASVARTPPNAWSFVVRPKKTACRWSVSTQPNVAPPFPRTQTRTSKSRSMFSSSVFAARCDACDDENSGSIGRARCCQDRSIRCRANFSFFRSPRLAKTGWP